MLFRYVMMSIILKLMKKVSNNYCSYSTVIPRDRLQRPNGVEVIDLDGDGTATMLSVPMESEEIMNSLASHKSEVRVFDVMVLYAIEVSLYLT